jgi:hypothetical protein
MAEMSVTACAEDLRPPHSITVIFPQLDVIPGKGIPEAWPPCSRVELGEGGEEGGAATDATIESTVLTVVSGAGKRPFGGMFPGHIIGNGREDLLPMKIIMELGDPGRSKAFSFF